MVKSLLTLSGLAIVGVVINHSVHWALIAMFWWTDRYQPVKIPNFDQVGNLNYWIIVLIDHFALAAVPIFLFASGFFAAFAGRNRAGSDWKVILGRIRHLLPPYLVWSSVFVAVQVLRGQALTLEAFFWTVVKGTAVPPFYFIPLLIKCYLIAPFLVFLARKRWKFLIVLTLALQLIAVISQKGSLLRPDYPGLEPVLAWAAGSDFLNLSGWFVLGILFYMYLTPIMTFLQKIRRLVLPAAVVFYVSAVVEWKVLLANYDGDWMYPRSTLLIRGYILLLILAYFTFGQALSKLPHWLGEIGGASYGIYLVHVPVLELTARVSYHYAASLLAQQVVFLLVLAIAGLVSPLLLMAAVKRSPLRGLYRYVFG